MGHASLGNSSAGHDKVAVFRKMLLDMLTENPGSFEVEKAYLATYRKVLADLVHGTSGQTVAAAD